MPLDNKVTHDETAELIQALHNLSILFRDRPMSKEQLIEYVKDLTNYHGWEYSFPKLLEAIRLARQKFADPGEVLPKPKFIMDRINPKA